MEVSNGHTNGYSKAPNGKMNGQSVGGKRRAPRQGPSLIGRLFSIIARLATWWTIITVLFRCPSTLEACDDSSPIACRTYFQVKDALTPHVEPYYETYAAPYIERAQPYYNIANERVLTPVKGYATKYGAPTLHQAQAYGQAQWDQNVQPQLAVYQKAATDKYEQTVAPYVARLSEAATPYYDIARTSALQTYHEILLPSYVLAQPYAARGYSTASKFTTDTVVPSAYWAWNKTYVFLDTTVWPQVRVLYVENVEPQLVRIGQRLGRYKEKSKAAVESVHEGINAEASSFVKPASSAVSSASSSVSSSVSSSTTVESKTHIPDAAEVSQHDSSEQVVAPPAGADESDLRKTARETVAEDLENWQTKFAKAADEGASEIEDRVEEISQRMIKENANDIGAALVKSLQATAKAEVDALQKDIVIIVKNAGDDREAGEQELNTAVRRAGLAIKEKAQEIRAWKESFELDMEAAITNAAESHFKILDSIRDLALQRIGMKWAWMDGVTYKDWAKFHELKDRFDEWTNDLKKLIITHPALEDAREASGKVEDSGMAVAQSAAQELVRLKQVGLWKIIAGDSSDNFDSDAMRSASEAAEQAKAEVAALAAEQAAASSRAAESSRAVEAEAEASRVAEAEASKAAQAAADATSIPDEDPLEEAAHVLEDESPAIDLPDEGASAPEEDPLESAASVIEDESPADDLTKEGSILSQVSSATEAASSVVEEAVSEASDSASSVISEASTIIAGSAPSSEEISSPDLASTVIPGDEQTFVVNNAGSSPADDDVQQPVTPEDQAEEHLDEQLEEEIIPESVEDKPVSAETETVKPAFLGVAAQSVADRKGPILDDDEEAAVEGLSEKAQDAYAKAVAQASEKYSLAMSAVSAQLYGTPEPEPVQEKMFASVSDVYAGAMDAANSRLSDALAAASKRVYGTPTATASPSYDWASVEALASQRLQEGRAWAEEQYESAKIALGLATATPTASTEKLLDQAKFNYYAGLGAAHARYSEFLAAASAAMSSLTATATPTDLAGTASSVASVATESANAVASGAQDDGLSVASYVSDGFEAAVSIVGDTVNAAAQEVLDAAEAVERGVVETWENVVNQLSVQVYGAPTPTAWYGNAYSDVEKYAAQASEQAAKQYEIVQNIVQELIKGKEPSYSESVLARLHAAYATGAASAAAYLNEATAAAGDSVNAAKEKVAAAAEAVREGVRRDEL